MDLHFFYSNYDLLNEKVTRIFSDGENLEIYVEFDININYIGNGLRSEFDYKPTHKFVIKEKHEVFSCDFPIIKEYKYINNKVIIVFEDKEIAITSNDIKCIQNIEVR